MNLRGAVTSRPVGRASDGDKERLRFVMDDNGDGTASFACSYGSAELTSSGASPCSGLGTMIDYRLQAGPGVRGNQGSFDEPVLITANSDFITPGESGDQAGGPMLVTDTGGGTMTLDFNTGCAATDNNVHYGPFSDVGIYGYSGSVCSVGAGGSLAGFDCGGLDSCFFIAAGHDGSFEGSHGTARSPDGSESERPPYASICGQTQELIDRCD